MSRKNGKGAGQAPLEMLAEWTGLEPATLGVTGRYSNRLNYHSTVFSPPRAFALEAPTREENTGNHWWVLRVSKPRPSPCKGDALPLS